MTHISSKQDIKFTIISLFFTYFLGRRNCTTYKQDSIHLFFFGCSTFSCTPVGCCPDYYLKLIAIHSDIFSILLLLLACILRLLVTHA